MQKYCLEVLELAKKNNLRTKKAPPRTQTNAGRDQNATVKQQLYLLTCSWRHRGWGFADLPCCRWLSDAAGCWGSSRQLFDRSPFFWNLTYCKCFI